MCRIEIQGQPDSKRRVVVDDTATWDEFLAIVGRKLRIEAIRVRKINFNLLFHRRV